MADTMNKYEIVRMSIDKMDKNKTSTQRNQYKVSITPTHNTADNERYFNFRKTDSYVCSYGSMNPG